MANNRREAAGEGSQKETRIACRRTGQVYDGNACRRCPYCYGDDGAVTAGDRESFCDFHPGVDPVHFGFPGDDQRTLRG